MRRRANVVRRAFREVAAARQARQSEEQQSAPRDSHGDEVSQDLGASHDAGASQDVRADQDVDMSQAETPSGQGQATTRPITTEEFQAWAMPPYCTARR